MLAPCFFSRRFCWNGISTCFGQILLMVFFWAPEKAGCWAQRLQIVVVKCRCTCSKRRPWQIADCKCCRESFSIDHHRYTVDGSEIRQTHPVEVGSLSHYLQGFIHPSLWRISSINSMCYHSIIHIITHYNLLINDMIDVYIYIYLEPEWPLFLKVNRSRYTYIQYLPCLHLAFQLPKLHPKLLQNNIQVSFKNGSTFEPGKSCRGIRALSSSVSGASLWHLLVTEPGRFARDTGNPDFFPGWPNLMRPGKLKNSKFQKIGGGIRLAIPRSEGFFIILSLKSCRNGWKPPLQFHSTFAASPCFGTGKIPNLHSFSLKIHRCHMSGPDSIDLIVVAMVFLPWLHPAWTGVEGFCWIVGVWWSVKWKVGKVPFGKRT